MFKNYLTIAWRNLYKNKVSSIINITGLTIGLSVALIIGLWIHSEFAYNKNFTNYENIAQVMQHQHFNADIQTDKAIPLPLAGALRKNYGSDFKYLALSSWTSPHILSFEDKAISQTGNFMERDAPEMLGLKMKYGVSSGLDDPAAVLISESTSQLFFDKLDPVGKVIKLDAVNLKIVGVYEDMPVTCSFSNVLFIAPWNLYARLEDLKNAGDDWGSNSFQLFAQIQDNGSMELISAKIKEVKLNNIGAEAAAALNPAIFLQPMSRWHLYAEFKNGVNTGGQIQFIWMFGIIGIFVLLLACINFMNLATARSEKRAKEVGIRKTIGSLRAQLITQFFCESLLITFSSFVCSLLLLQCMLPLFNSSAGKEMMIPWESFSFWVTGTCFPDLSKLGQQVKFQ